MNRELKFRAFCKNDIEIKQPLLFEQRVIDDELFFVCSEDEEIRYDFRFPFIDPGCWILQQFTGLKDKNRREIFEGDILEIPWPKKENNPFYEPKSFDTEFWERGIVKYYDEYARFGLEFYSPYGGEGYTGKEQHISDYIDSEIIGNIFQNSELLSCNK